MSLHSAAIKVIKTGRSKTPFLLFFGNRKQEDNESVKPLTSVLTAILLLLIATVLGICIYAFLTGKLG